LVRSKLPGTRPGLWVRGISAALFLLRMQAWHDGYTMRQRAGEIDVKKFTPPTDPR